MAPKMQQQSLPAQVKPTIQERYVPPMHYDEDLSSYDEHERSNTPVYPPPPEETMV